MATNNIDEELKRAVRGGNLEEVKALLSAGANVFCREPNGDTLHHLSRSVEITRETWRCSYYGADARNRNGDTPLHAAIKQGKEWELVRELLRLGYSIDIPNRKGNTALNLAVKKQNIDLAVIQVLLEYGADLNVRYRELRALNNRSSPLHNAMHDLACAKLLIKFTLINNFNEDYVKVIDLNLYKKHYNYDELSSYLNDSVREIFQMKTHRIKDDFSLYEFLRNDFDRRVLNNVKRDVLKRFNIHLIRFNRPVLYNNQLSMRIAKLDYSANYPIYNCIISERIKPYLERAGLLDKLSKLNIYTVLDMSNQDVEKKVILDSDSAYKLTEYLFNNDLSNSIAAFDVSNRYDSQSLSSLNNRVEPDARFQESSASGCVKRARLE